MNNKNKWIFVTGGSRGIGKAIVNRQCKAGYNVIFTYRNTKAEAENIQAELELAEHQCKGIKCDVSDNKKVKDLAFHLCEEYGAPYALINNAGITRDMLLMSMDEVDWVSVVHNNLDSTYNVTRAFLPNMLEQKDGRIIQISSVTAFKGNTGQTSYAASKAGMIGMTRSLAQEVGRFNLKVNAVAPGFIETDMVEKIPDQQKRKVVSSIPLRRMGKAEDVAMCVDYLLGEGGDYITGQTFVIDGGLVS